jgi:hypothetical protein
MSNVVMTRVARMLVALLVYAGFYAAGAGGFSVLSVAMIVAGLILSRIRLEGPPS